MIRSMTGFGQAVRHSDGFSVQVEIKTINHRYNEISFRLPREYASFEDSLKQEVRRHVKRGRTDVTVSVDRSSGAGAALRVDWSLAERYMALAREIGTRYGLESTISVQELLGVPGLLVAGETEILQAEDVEQQLLACLNEALHALVGMREAEGRHLRKDLTERLAALRAEHAHLHKLAPAAAEEYRERLAVRMREVLGALPADDARLAMEVALFAERISVDEELTRLNSHFDQFMGLLDGEEPSGRKLDFLIQEMNREVNTIGSKANHAQMAGIVVEMKAELEKIREQVQNIE